MTKWFGPDWGSYLCREAERIDVPVGAQCLHCREGFEPGDRGVTVSTGGSGEAPLHPIMVIGLTQRYRRAGADGKHIVWEELTIQDTTHGWHGSGRMFQFYQGEGTAA